MVEKVGSVTARANFERHETFERAFLQRLAALCRRFDAMIRGGWDVNLFHVAHEELQELCEASQNHDCTEESERLMALETFLGSFIEAGTLPNEHQSAEVRKLLESLSEACAGVARDTSDATEGAALFSDQGLSDPEIEVNGLPASSNFVDRIVPPRGFIPGWEPKASEELDYEREFQRKAQEASQPVVTEPGLDPDLARLASQDLEISVGDISDQLLTGDAPIHEDAEMASGWDEEPESEEADLDTLYLLHADESFSEQLSKKARKFGFQVEAFADTAEFLEVLGALTPQTVVVSAPFLEDIDAIGQAIVRARSKGGPLPFVALADHLELSTRLRVMRAGIDCILPSDSSPVAIGERLKELITGATEQPYRVLIVEDDRSQALFAQSILRKAGMQAQYVRDPMGVIEALEEFRPDLILMDLYMPGCDGMELTTIIRERSEFLHTPIVFLSGEADKEKHFDALSAGGDDFLSKPIRPRHLISAVTNRVRRARAMTERARQPASPHSVSGLYDRAFLIQRINRHLDAGESPGGVSFLEVDSPFRVRRQIGLGQFEEVMDQLGTALVGSLSDDLVIARYGEFSFCVFLPDREIDEIERQIRKTIYSIKRQTYEVGEHSISLTLSAGIAALSSDFGDAGAAIGAAESALARQPDEPARVMLHKQKTEPLPVARTEMLGQAIEQALEHGNFQLLYQPIVALAGDATRQYHALLRLPIPESEPLEARAFLGEAARRGLLGQIDRWVVTRAMSVIDERQRGSDDLRLFINQSYASLAANDRVGWLRSLLSTRGVNPRRLCLEFKLPEIARKLKVARDRFTELQQLGVGICVGAFDGSSASLGALDHLCCDFVRLVPPRQLRDATVSEVVSRLHDTGRAVIVPGIEDAKTLAALWNSGADYIQGNFVQQPEADMVFEFSEAQF